MSSVADAIKLNDGAAVGKPGVRAASWTKKFPSLTEISCGLTFMHKATEQMRANDRAYASLPLSALSALHARLQVSAPMARGGSDHQSIVLRFKDSEGETFRSATWPYRHPCWSHTLVGVLHGWNPTGCWVEDLKVIENLRLGLSRQNVNYLLSVSLSLSLPK